MGFAGKVALAFVFDGGKETITDDKGSVCEFDVGRSVPETIYSEFGKGDEVFGAVDSEDGMSYLTHDDGSSYQRKVSEGWVRGDAGHTAETGLLGVVADEFEAFGSVLDDIGCDGWVVGDLLDEKSSATDVVGVWPVAVEKPIDLRSEGSGGQGDVLSEDGVEGSGGRRDETGRRKEGRRTFSRSP